jgi:hypothetical protein
MMLSLNGRVGKLAALLLFGGGVFFLAGCGGGEQEEAHADVEEELAAGVESMVEIDLGGFTVTDSDAKAKRTRFVAMHVYAVVPKEKAEEFTHTHESHRERVRGVVISLVRQTESRELADPDLKLLRSKLASALRREMKTELLEQVVFGDFTVEML